MENSSCVWHGGKDNDLAVYELLKHELTPTTSKSINSGQKLKEERAVHAAVVGNVTVLSTEILLIGKSKERMRRVRLNRMNIAGLNASTADEFTLEVQKDMAAVYMQFQPGHVNKLNAETALLLVQFTQRWGDNDFIAALNGGKTQRVYRVIEPD